MIVGKPFSPHHAFTGIFIPDALIPFRGINAAEKICLARLFRYCGKKNHCWPSQEELAEELGVEVRTVHSYLTHLEEQGFIRTEQRGLGLSNLYYVLGHPILGAEETGNNFPVKGGTHTSDPERQDYSTPVRNTSLTEESHVKSISTSLLENENSSLSRELLPKVFFSRYKNHKGTKLSSEKRDKQTTLQWLDEREESPDQIMAAQGNFLADEYWRSAKWPLSAFRKQFDKYCEGTDIYVLEPRLCAVVYGFPGGPIAPDPEQTPPMRDHPAEWNRLVPAAPYDWNPKRAPVDALRMCEMDEEFVRRFDEVCVLAQQIHEAQGKEASWLILPWILKVCKDDPRNRNWSHLLYDLKGMAHPRGQIEKPKKRDALEESMEESRRKIAAKKEAVNVGI